MVQRRKTKARATKARATQRRPAKRQTRRKEPEAFEVMPVPPNETAAEALVGIAQDAVVILRRELAFRAAVSMQQPGLVKMKDLVPMLKLLVDLVPEAMKGHEGQTASYEALTPDERVQFAALLSKVEYS